MIVSRFAVGRAGRRCGAVSDGDVVHYLPVAGKRLHDPGRRELLFGSVYRTAGFNVLACHGYVHIVAAKGWLFAESVLNFTLQVGIAHEGRPAAFRRRLGCLHWSGSSCACGASAGSVRARPWSGRTGRRRGRLGGGRSPGGLCGR